MLLLNTEILTERFGLKIKYETNSKETWNFFLEVQDHKDKLERCIVHEIFVARH